MIITHEFSASEWKSGKVTKGLFVTDFDGTLLRSDRTFAETDLTALKRLGDLNVTRVIATGRSVFSFNRAADSNLPMDFVIFSTGAGVVQFPSGRIVRKVSLEENEVRRVTEVLMATRLDFMIHRPIPDNHMFAYFKATTGNTDFENRIALYKPYAFPLEQIADGFGPATQLLAVLPPSRNGLILDSVRKKLSDFNVIQTTSPLDGKSTWIEIFPANVSKSLTAEWLAQELGVESQNILSLGNDYNDIDLLEWSATSFVVANAPEELKTRFPTVASNDRCGVAEAVGRWLAARGSTSFDKCPRDRT